MSSMNTMNRQRIYSKLEKLREFAERDCGNETENAIRIIERLLKDYNITDFHYTPFKANKERSQSTRTEYANRSQYQDNNAFKKWRRVSYTSVMKDVLYTFLVRFYRESSSIKGNKVYVFLTDSEYTTFTIRLSKLKSEWKKRMKQLNRDMDDFIVRMN